MDEDQKQTKKDRQLREQLKAAYQRVFSTPSGKLVLWDILSMCNIFSELPFADYGSLAHAEGKRTVGLRITEAVMDADAKIYIEMLKEHSDAE